MKTDTIIVVGQRRTDEFNNLWVTPKSGGAEIKIGEKRKQLHPLFQSGNKVSLEWDNYNNNDYVKDAKLVSGEAKTKAEEPPQPKPKSKSYGRDEDRTDSRTALMCAVDFVMKQVEPQPLGELKKGAVDGLRDRILESASKFNEWFFRLHAAENIQEEIDKQ